MSRFGTFFGVTILSFVASALSAGILPIWVGMIPLFIFLLYTAGEVFRGTQMDASVTNATTGVTFEKTMGAWAQSLYNRNLSAPENWNCKYCGGPNIEQVKCQYCGMVKE